MDGWGKLSVQNLKYSIDQKYFFRKIYLFSGIRHIGLENAKLLSKHFIISEFKKLSKQFDYEDLLNIDGIGETQVNSIKSFFQVKQTKEF